MAGERTTAFRGLDVSHAYVLMDKPHHTNLPVLLRPLLKQCHRVHAEISRPNKRDYYWTAAESKYTTDVMFRNRAALGADLSRAGVSWRDEIWQ